VLVHQPSANTRTALTNEQGEYAFLGLKVGGPYTVTASFAGFRPAGFSKIILTAGRIDDVRITLRVEAAETIEVQDSATPETTSQRTRFGRDDVEDLPSVTHDPKDVVQLSPDAYVDGENKALSIGGANNRFNSVTIDGIRQDDDFGLNGNGYPTARSPIGMNAIEQITVERSPFDVRYGSFLGGNVNIVTKSGTNEFHGSIVGAYTSQALSGNKNGVIELDEVDSHEARYALDLGGPILRDKLHFFVAVEGLTAGTPNSVGPVGSGAANEIDGITVADVERARSIARGTYGYDAGTPSRSLDEGDLKLLAKIDVQLAKRQHLSAKYQRSAGNVISDAPAFDGNLPLTSNWFDQRDTLHAFSLRLNSDWTDRFATEIELAGKLVRSRPSPLEGGGFTQAEITTADGGTILLGPDPFRQANLLDNDTLHAKASGNYLLGTHLLLGGLELDRIGIDNLFVPNSDGAAEYASLDAFEARTPTSIFYSNAISNDPADASARWHMYVWSGYLQDQASLTSELTLTGGVRAELYEAADAIRLNPNFEDRHGFRNDAALRDRWAFLPRVGASYRPDAIPGLNVRGGTGLYSGGAPNVWLSNSYSNDGVGIDSAFSDDPSVVDGFDGRVIPTELTEMLVAGDGNVDAMDPDFRIPTEWKTALGADYAIDLPRLGPLMVETNYVYGNTIHGVMWQDLRRDLDALPDNTPVGRLPDGRPYYDADMTDGASFNPRRGYDMLLTNTSKGQSHTFSLALGKVLPAGFSVTGAYAFQRVTEVSPATSSRSVSNYGQAAIGLDPNDPDAATSNYERRHRLIGTLRYQRALLADLFGEGGRLDGLTTDLAIFAELRSGQPYSYTFGDSAGGDDLARLFGDEREFARRNRELFYVPKGDGSDVILNGITEEEMDAFLESTGLEGYRGEIAPRNAFRGEWYKRIDLRFGQDLPGFARGQKARFFVDVQNVGNLLNRRWGRLEQAPFPQLVPVVDVAVDPLTGKYVYSNLRTERPEQIVVAPSLWRIQLSLMYQF
jgi:hypothetical protein